MTEKKTHRTRRQLLKGAAATTGWLALSAARKMIGPQSSTSAEGADVIPQAYLPLVSQHYPAVRVVRVHSSGATNWNFFSGWWGDFVDQEVVNEMIEQGLKVLTATTSVEAAWDEILPLYQPGQKIAVKVNLNNGLSCDDNDNTIDALIEVVNGLIRSLVMAGIQEEDVWVYEGVRWMPSRFYDRREYQNAVYMDVGGCADQVVTYNHVDSSLKVTFSNPALQMERWLADLLYEATYVINMPLLKLHSYHPVTLGFKNHFGSLSYLHGDWDDNPHIYLIPSDYRYSSTTSPLVDIYANPNIADKTVLTLGDGLFGAPHESATPTPWHNTFGGQAPNSLLFSRDPVAIDCVMCDLLDAEWGIPRAAYDYLKTARRLKLGRFERGKPWGSGYNQILYEQVEV
jgi:uncharacterized protein (DUF362 family)